jgi:DNA repair exonuclease SbcCD ATPase subunit
LKELLDQKRRIEKACERAKKSLTGLETYLETLKIEHLPASKLQDVVNSYDRAAEELDDKITKLDDELAETNEAISSEQKQLSGPVGNPKLTKKVSIGVFADFEGEISIALIYGGVVC